MVQTRKKVVIYPKSLMKKRELFARICKHNTIITRNMGQMRQENQVQLDIRRQLETFAITQRKITLQKIMLSVDDLDKNKFFIQEALVVEKAFADEKQRRIQALETILAELKK